MTSTTVEFFNINDLAGLRIELPVVFRHTHARILPMIDEGVVDGLRIDHMDGLLDPKAYFDRLRHAGRREPFYLVVEKILARHEGAARGLADRWNHRIRVRQSSAWLLINPAGEEGLHANLRGVHRA